MITVVLADDHEMVRVGFKMILEKDPGIEVVGEAAEGMQAYALVASRKPDILLLDLSMPPAQSGLVACEKIVHDFPDTKVIILTMFAEPEYLYYTIRKGAKGYLLKSATPTELLRAIHMVNEGDSYIHPKMAEALAGFLAEGGKKFEENLEQLTPREMEVLVLLARGYTNREISERIFLSVKTIEAHRAKLYAKLGFSNRAELVEFALKHHLLEL